jgi:hypothetical protein
MCIKINKVGKQEVEVNNILQLGQTWLVYCMQLLNLRLDFSKISQNDNDLGAEITKR